jgi:asparagine synthase (glutamine-hydrolysing)
MCGIAGVIGLRNLEIAKKMLKKINHRGPDGEGVWISPISEAPATLCHSRLSILDLSNAGSQPFHSKNGRYTIIFNGEIYNFLELKEYLCTRHGISFASDTDTEVLLYGLIYEGLNFLLKCNGMWAFCLWDRLESKATFCRDRFGVKPLYFTRICDYTLGFSSEMKGLTPLLSSISPSKYIDDIFSNQFDYEFSDLCAIDGITRLPPGSVGTFQNGQLSVTKWWNTLDHLFEVEKDYPTQVDSWRELFFDSIRIRMRSDVRIGTALSGGLDSSCVLAAMSEISAQSCGFNNRLASDWQHAICCSYPGSSLDESHYAQHVAESCNTIFNSIEINPSFSEFNIVDMLAKVEDPYLTMPLPMLETYKAIKENGISVTLDGHGADELFSGYGHLAYALRSAKNIREFSEILEIDRSTRTGVFSDKERLSTQRKLKTRLYYLLCSLGVLPWSIVKQSAHELGRKFTSGYFTSILSEAKRDISLHPRFRQLDVFSQVLYEIFHITILPTLLRNYDRYSMSNGLEIRMPFMDWRLVCYTFALPMQSKIGASFTKRIQRDALSGYLIDEVRLRRDKIGWNAPAHEWFHGSLKYLLDEKLLNATKSSHYSSFRTAYDKFYSIRRPSFVDGFQLWNASMPLLWLESLDSSAWAS